MNTICTLFEKHYHHGVAVLVNSLAINGFKGSVYAGYRGKLPAWTAEAISDSTIDWEGASTMAINSDIKLHFLPMHTEAHFTNYKAHFMIDLWNGPAKSAETMFYFDPDIVFIGKWNYFLEWVRCGVAVCEDVNSPVWVNHPRRVGWREFFGKHGHQLRMKEPLYVNAGFLGLKKEDKQLLEIWKHMMDVLAPRIGGLNKSTVSGETIPEEEKGAFSPFGQPDQDVLNAAIEAFDGEISFAGKEGMAFIAGAALIPHALGKVKPWVLKPLSESIKGNPPRVVDKEYWKYAAYPIQSHGGFKIATMKSLLKLTALIGRIYRRGD